MFEAGTGNFLPSNRFLHLDPMTMMEKVIAASTASSNGRFFTVWLVMSWYSSNIGVLLLNKYLLSNYGFKYPIFLTMCHMTACSVFSYVAVAMMKVGFFCCCFNLDFSEFPPILDFSRIKSLIRFCPDRKYSESALSPPQNLESPKFSLLEQITPMQTVSSRIQFYKIATLSFVFCGSVVSGNVSLRYLPVSFNQAIGATTPFFTAMFAYIMTVRRESWITYVTLIPVVTGVFIASGVCLHSLPTW